MKRTFRVLALAAALVLTAAPAFAQGGHSANDGHNHSHDMPAASPTGVKAEMLMWISDAESKLNDLAEAMPENKYGWSPDKGVRTPAQVFMHVAGANYGVPSFWGVAPPAGYDFRTYESSLTKKAEIQSALRESFAHLKAALSGASDEDFEKPVDLFGMKTTVRGAYLMLLSHSHEHLGQSIAYARMNKVTPPWTAKQQAEIAKMKEKGGK